MDKITFDRLIKPLVDIYDEIELDIIRDILNKLESYNSVSGSIEWYLEKLQDLGALKRNTLNILKKDKSKINKVLKEVISDSSQIDSMEKLQSLFDNKLLDRSPLEIFNSASINNLINNATKDVNDIMNLIDSKVLEGTDEAYKKILNKAYIETSSGVYSYQESIRNALKEFAKEGIDAGHYANGRSISIEAIVRRDVITRTNKLTGDITLETAKEIGTNLVYVDQHEGARIRTPYMKNDYEAHAEWQGKVYMIDGSNDKYDNFYEKTGYGEMLGLKGINCYHDFRPFFEGEKVPKRITEEDNKEQYELFEKQRSFERRIRELKREKEIYKSIDKDEYKKVSNKLKNKNNEYDEFLKQNDLRRDYSREYIASYKTSETSILKENKSDVLVVKPDIQYYEDVTEEMFKTATPNSHEIVFDDYFIDEDGIKHPIKGQEKISLPSIESDEYKMLETIKKTFGGEVHMVPRIETEKGYKGLVKTKTPDYRWRGKKWELKTPTLKCEFENTLETFLKRKDAKKQAKKMIIDYVHFKDKTNDEIVNIVQKTLKNRNWVEDIIIMRKDEVIKIFSKRNTK